MTGRVYQNILVMDHILPVCEASCSILDAEKNQTKVTIVIVTCLK